MTEEAIPLGWRAVREVHMLGGLSAFNGLNQQAILRPVTLLGQEVSVTIQQYAALFHALSGLGLRIVGVDFYTNERALKGHYPPEWRPFHATTSSDAWLVEKATRNWSYIGHGAHRARNGYLWDLASKVSYQLRLLSWRMRQLSLAYRNQLDACVGRGDFRPGLRFEDEFTSMAYGEVQAFFIDACIVRDYLAEFVGEYCLPDVAKGAKTMGALAKRLEKLGGEPGLQEELKNATQEGGWLHELGSYRDLIVHSAPLAKASQMLLAATQTIPLTQGQLLPAISLPLPEQPGEIRAARASGSIFADFEAQVRRFIGPTGSMPTRDALAYAHEVTGRLADLADKLSIRSPIPAQMTTLTEADLAGPIRFTRG